MTSWREAAYAVLLVAVLSSGVVGVLLLNTSMQQQAGRIDRQNTRIDDLGNRIQQLHTATERRSSPGWLARRAERLDLRPIRQVHYVPGSAVSAR